MSSSSLPTDQLPDPVIPQPCLADPPVPVPVPDPVPGPASDPPQDNDPPIATTDPVSRDAADASPLPPPLTTTPVTDPCTSDPAPTPVPITNPTDTKTDTTTTTTTTPPVVKSNARPLIVSGPSGSGKSTLLNRLFSLYPGQFAFSVSHTTRPPRKGEKNGVNYHFVSKAKFESLVAQNYFLEHATFADHLYGTSKSAVDAVTKSHKICVLDIEMNGVKSIKDIYQSGGLAAQPYYLFIRPTSMADIEQRLRARGTESEDTIAKRMAMAQVELDYADSGAHDMQIINDDQDDAFAKLRDWIVDHYDIKPQVATVKKSKFCQVQ